MLCQTSSGLPVLSQIDVTKYGYTTSEKKPFELLDKIQVSTTHLTPTPEFDAWFTDDDDQLNCCAFIQKLNNFPVESSKD